MEKQEPKKTCTKCQTYGFWPIGRLVPIGKYDSQDWGDEIVKCPWVIILQMGMIKVKDIRY
jgi:hypothetical protein